MADPGTELLPAEGDANGGELEPASDQHFEEVEHNSHPGPRQYVLIAVVLVVLTAIEIGISYIEMNANLQIFLLFALAFVKFFLVAAWFTHMKQDSPFFRRLFIIGIVLASFVYGIVILVFSSTVLKS